MDDRTTENILHDSLVRLGVEVRVEDLEESRGGFCRLNDEPLVVVNRTAPRSSRIEVLIEALSQLDTSGIYLPPAIRDRLEADTNDSHKDKRRRNTKT